ncbi:hypothetical protein ACHAWF_004356 [Thalassiosira exigua]
MPRCHRRPVAAAAAAAVSAALSCRSSSDDRNQATQTRATRRCVDRGLSPVTTSCSRWRTHATNDEVDRILCRLHQMSIGKRFANNWTICGLAAKCEAAINSNSESSDTVPSDESTHDSEERNPFKIDHYYVKMDPNDVDRTSLLDSHAVFGALWGKGLIERYNVYQRVDLERMQNHGKQKRELTVVDVKLGGRLNGHGGIAHGGIISLLFDEAMGWAFECMRDQDSSHDPSSTAVTANLTVDFRAPFLEGSEAVVRVYHEETQGRKIYFSATLESPDGSVVFAEAKSLFILVRLKRGEGR